AREARRLAARLATRPRLARNSQAVIQGLVEGPQLVSARDAIFGRIRAALANETEPGPAPGYELWPAGTWTAPGDLYDRFREEFRRDQGEEHRFGNLDEGKQVVAHLNREPGGPRTALADHPTCRLVGEYLPAEKVEIVAPAMDRQHLAAIPLALLPAEF